MAEANFCLWNRRSVVRAHPTVPASRILAVRFLCKISGIRPVPRALIFARVSPVPSQPGGRGATALIYLKRDSNNVDNGNEPRTVRWRAFPPSLQRGSSCHTPGPAIQVVALFSAHLRCCRHAPCRSLPMRWRKQPRKHPFLLGAAFHSRRSAIPGR